MGVLTNTGISGIVDRQKADRRENLSVPNLNMPKFIRRLKEAVSIMDFQLGEVIKLKKAHPCGENQWKILRVGMDFRLQCAKCGREVMVPRKLVEKNFRGYIKKEEAQ